TTPPQPPLHDSLPIGTVDDRQVRHLRKLCEVADVSALHGHHAWVAAQAVVQLAIANIDGVHAPGAPREQQVSEAAGGCADVEGHRAGRVDGPLVECALQLEGAAADVLGPG